MNTTGPTIKLSDLKPNEWDIDQLDEWGLKVPKFKKVEFEVSDDKKLKNECPNCGHKF